MNYFESGLMGQNLMLCKEFSFRSGSRFGAAEQNLLRAL